MAEDGTLAVGISPMEGSLLDGVAYFAPKRDDSGARPSRCCWWITAPRKQVSGRRARLGWPARMAQSPLAASPASTDAVSVVEDLPGSAPPDSAAGTAAPAPAESVERGERGRQRHKGGKGGKGKGVVGTPGNDDASAAGWASPSPTDGTSAPGYNRAMSVMLAVAPRGRSQRSPDGMEDEYGGP